MHIKFLKQKAAAVGLAAVMTLSLTSAAFAAEFPDMPDKDHWSYEALQAAVDNGLLTGKDGALAPKANLTRAEMAAIVVRSFGATEAASLDGFTDVAAGAWYYDEVGQAYRMGVLTGDNSTMAPNRSITRQEAFTVLARALKLEDGSAAGLSQFSDASDVADWAVGPLAAMAKAGYVSGDNGALNPRSNITRAEFAQVMHNIFGQYITKAGEYTQVAEGNVMVNAPGVTIKDADIKGDIVIGDGVGDGDVYLDNVSVSGRVVVRGGGVNSIHFKNSKSGQVVISKVQGDVRVVTDADSSIETVTVAGGEKPVIVEGAGAIGTVAVQAETPVEVKDAKVDTITTAVKADVTISGTTVVVTVQVAAGAGVSVTDTAVVASIEVPAHNGEAPKITVSATAKVEVVKAGSDVVLDGKADKVEVPSEDVSVTNPDGEKVDAEVTGKPGATPPDNSGDEDNKDEENGSGSGSGSGSGAETHRHVWSDWEDVTEATCTEPGKQVRVCTGAAPDHQDECNATEADKTREIPALGHKFGGTQDPDEQCARCGKTYGEVAGDCPHIHVTEITVPATCTQDGYWQEVCDDCHVTKDHQVIPATNHEGETWVEEKQVTEATCAQEGSIYTYSYCAKCGAKVESTIKNEVIPKLEHTWGAWKSHAEIDGLHTRTCSGCGATEDANCDISYTDLGESGHRVKCSVCDLDATVEHKYNINGICDSCGAKTDPHVHNYVDGTCSCGDSTDHNWVDGTCTASDHSSCKCPNLTGHTDDGRCETCGYTGPNWAGSGALQNE